MCPFKKLGISEHVLRVIADEKFEKPSEIQEKSIPLVMEGKDVICGSATGSGKTLVFGAGIINKCVRGGGLQTLVLTPTRELADQVAKEIKKFARYKHLEIQAIYGGVSINPQIDGLRTADVVVGTPGRVLDHMERRTIYFGNLKILVLDEADRMLDMGFIEDVETIIRECPQERQTMLFSATIPPDIAELAERYMRDPVKVSAETYVDPKKLHQVYYDVPENMKFSLLVHLLKHEHAGLVMVFCNTRSNTDFVANNLKENGIEAEAIHGGLTQDRRSRIMDMFHAKNVYVLVCTDVAARGLDIPGVSHVYNYDMPSESKQYIHRIGRTARAGAEGRAVSILSQRDYDNFRFVLRDYEVDVEKQDLPEIEHARIGWRHEPRSGYGRGGPGGRSSGYGRGGGGRSYGHSSGPRSGGYGGGRPYSDRPRSSSIGQRSRGFPKKRESGDHNMRNY